MFYTHKRHTSSPGQGGSLVEHQPMLLEVIGLIPHQGTGPGCSLIPGRGRAGGRRSVFPLPLPLKATTTNFLKRCNNGL